MQPFNVHPYRNYSCSIYTLIAGLYPTTDKFMYGECEMTLENQDRENIDIIYACDDWIKQAKQLKEYTHPPPLLNAHKPQGDRKLNRF